MEKRDIKSMSFYELRDWLSQFRQPAFRAGQIFDWLHAKHALRFSDMTNLPKSLAAQLDAEGYITVFSTRRKLVSKIDGTIKYLFELPDGELVETVVMRYHHGLSACLSTQVGCRMGCTFCASTKAGFVRNLVPSEILEQLYAAQENLGERISSVVLMGIGEPLDNYDNVMRFLSLLSDERGNSMSLRHVSLSTCGLVNQIDRLAEEKLGLTLSVSLHAPNDEIRQKTMPVSRRYPMEELLRSCRNYTEKTGRRISFEYALIAGVNDSRECAAELAQRLTGMLCHVNLIPVNEIRETSFHRSGQGRVGEFQSWLVERGINTTVRRTLGADINAACGQLRRDNTKSEGGLS